MAPPLRHELKFQLNMGEYMILSRHMDTLLTRDPNGDEFNEYRVRSLYFDTPFDDALRDKLSGQPERRKYRVRVYNGSDRLIKLECKRKIGDLTSKEALSIPRDLADQLIARDTAGLLKTSEPLLHAMYAQLMVHASRPVVIVDYLREAYTHPAEDIRVTFDKRLRSGMRSVELFNPAAPLLDPFPNPTVILEVKYNRVLPGYIRKAINQITGQRLAVSKYVLCRAFDNPSVAFSR
ncbi:MAG: polyphosphate polymerase domain-containing protein [Oscillospiraceae bacterium]|jgi:hypothetical protein|nr:polyphosphate polymerase domain-containing protein [Oscillospiraceae bacterium]